MNSFYREGFSAGFAESYEEDENGGKEDEDEMMLFTGGQSNNNEDTDDLTHKAPSKNHTCSQCGKQFSCAGHLRTHFVVHTGERPFKCATCGAQFSHSSSMRRHQRTHNPVPPKDVLSQSPTQAGAPLPLGVDLGSPDSLDRFALLTAGASTENTPVATHATGSKSSVAATPASGVKVESASTPAGPPEKKRRVSKPRKPREPKPEGSAPRRRKTNNAGAESAHATPIVSIAPAGGGGVSAPIPIVSNPLSIALPAAAVQAAAAQLAGGAPGDDGAKKRRQAARRRAPRVRKWPLEDVRAGSEEALLKNVRGLRDYAYMLLDKGHFSQAESFFKRSLAAARKYPTLDLPDLQLADELNKCVRRQSEGTNSEPGSHVAESDSRDSIDAQVVEAELDEGGEGDGNGDAKGVADTHAAPAPVEEAAA